MAKDVVWFSIRKESKDKIFSLLHLSYSGSLSLIFPLTLEDELQYIALLNGQKCAIELQNYSSVVDDRNDKIYLLQINTDYIITIQPLLLQIVSAQSLIKCTGEEGLFFEKILKELDQCYQIKMSHLICRFYLNIIVQYLNELLIRDKTFKLREEVLAKDFLRILQLENYPKHQVQNYSERLFVSRRYLTKAVRNTFGKTPKMLIDQRIIYEAKKLLSTRITVYEISERLSFESSASFTVFFKKHTHCTPSEFRKKILNS